VLRALISLDATAVLLVRDVFRLTMYNTHDKNVSGRSTASGSAARVFLLGTGRRSSSDKEDKGGSS